jgi:hypothetical protein
MDVFACFNFNHIIQFIHSVHNYNSKIVLLNLKKILIMFIIFITWLPLFFYNVFYNI